MAEIEFTITDNSGEFKKATAEMIPLILEEWGLAGERFAKEEITAAVYDTPPSKSYNRTGRLRASITFATKEIASKVGKEAKAADGVKKKQVKEQNAVVIGTNVEYAVYVEYGTTKMTPRPYLKPAVENHIEKYKEIALNRITNA